jgi:hypothetical protein
MNAQLSNAQIHNWENITAQSDRRKVYKRAIQQGFDVLARHDQP